MNQIISSIKAYFSGARVEIQKVAWPTRAQVIAHTKLVIGISLAMSLFLGVVDYALTWIIQQIL